MRVVTKKIVLLAAIASVLNADVLPKSGIPPTFPQDAVIAKGDSIAPPPPTPLKNGRYQVENKYAFFEVYDSKKKEIFYTLSCDFVDLSDKYRYYSEKELKKIKDRYNKFNKDIQIFAVSGHINFSKITNSGVTTEECLKKYKQVNKLLDEGKKVVVVEDMMLPPQTLKMYKEKYVENLLFLVYSTGVGRWINIALPFPLYKKESRKFLKYGIAWRYRNGKWMLVADEDYCKEISENVKCVSEFRERGGYWFLKTKISPMLED